MNDFLRKKVMLSVLGFLTLGAGICWFAWRDDGSSKSSDPVQVASIRRVLDTGDDSKPRDAKPIRDPRRKLDPRDSSVRRPPPATREDPEVKRRKKVRDS
jgi:hypothetical protein